MDKLQLALLAAGGVLVSSGLIIGGTLGTAAVVLPLSFFVFFWLVLGQLGARFLLPNDPAKATRLINSEWVGWVGIGSLAGGAAIFLATKLPKSAGDAEEAGLTVVSVVAGLAVVEVLKKAAVDEKMIEKAVEESWKRKIRAAFAPRFADGTIRESEPMPGNPNVEMKSIPWQAVFLDEVHGGYGREARNKRAQDLKPPW